MNQVSDSNELMTDITKIVSSSTMIDEIKVGNTFSHSIKNIIL